MPSTIICPNCRRPQEDSGRLTCADCSAILPSTHTTAPATTTQSRPAAAATSALDEFSIPQRPTGAMTLLRNDLRSEDKGRPQSGWLDNIMPAKKPKETVESDAPVKARAIREVSKPASAPIIPAEEAPQEAQAQGSGLGPGFRPEPEPGPSRTTRSRPRPRCWPPRRTAPPALNQQVPIIGVAAGVTFGFVALLALLQGKDGLLGLLVLLTVAILGASIVGIWNRPEGSKSLLARVCGVRADISCHGFRADFPSRSRDGTAHGSRLPGDPCQGRRDAGRSSQFVRHHECPPDHARSRATPPGRRRANPARRANSLVLLRRRRPSVSRSWAIAASRWSSPCSGRRWLAGSTARAWFDTIRPVPTS